MTDDQLAIKNVGKQDPKRHLGLPDHFGFTYSFSLYSR
jgi:hypothetical protein